MTALPPPGWFADPDPSVPGRQRWWDGERWTAQTQDAAASVEPQAPVATTEPAAPAAPAAPAWSNPWHQPGPDPDPLPDRAPDVARPASAVPLSRGSDRFVGRRTERETRVVHLPETSRWSWIVGGSPFLALAAYAGLAFGIGTPVDPWLFLAACGGLVVILAFVDSASMRGAGYAHPPTGFLVLLTPIAYLIVRTVITRQYTKGGAGPLILFGITLVVCAYPYFIVGQIALAELAATSSVL